MNTTPQRDASPFFDGRHSRTENLIGKKAVEKLCKSRVTVFGLGGVGSYVVEALARAGVGNFILIDKDRVSESNINRQLYATISSIGRNFPSASFLAAIEKTFLFTLILAGNTL